MKKDKPKKIDEHEMRAEYTDLSKLKGGVAGKALQALPGRTNFGTPRAGFAGCVSDR